MALTIKEVPVEGYETVIEALDPSVGLHALIAVHDTTMGPALGGCRIYPYASVDDALFDVLRLSQGMTYKSAVAEIGLGGGKSVIIADPHEQKTDALLKSFGKAIDSLDGRYICAEDMGSTPEDMVVIRSETRWVTALPGKESSGDPSRFTAWGCFRGIQAVAYSLWGARSLKGKCVAIQGVGSVGAKLAEQLFWAGAELIISDIDPQRAENVASQFGAQTCSIDKVLEVPCDILAPCAIGGILNEKSIPRLQCTAIAGGANNQLLKDEHGGLLMERGILYAPDFVINGGGIINVACELEPDGYNPRVARRKVDKIYEVLLSIFEVAERRGLPPSHAAIDLARHKLHYHIGKRESTIHLHH